MENNLPVVERQEGEDVEAIAVVNDENNIPNVEIQEAIPLVNEEKVEDNSPNSLYYLNESLPTQKYKLRVNYLNIPVTVTEEESESEEDNEEDGKAVDLDCFIVTCVDYLFLRALVGSGNSMKFCMIGVGKFKVGKKPEYNPDIKRIIQMDMVPILQTGNNTFVYIFRKLVPWFVRLVEEMTHTKLYCSRDYLQKRNAMPPFTFANSSKSNAPNNMILFAILERLSPFLVTNNGLKLSGRSYYEFDTRDKLYSVFANCYEESHRVSELINEEEDENGCVKAIEETRVLFTHDRSLQCKLWWAVDGATEYQEITKVLTGYIKARNVEGVLNVETFNTLNLGEGADVGGFKLTMVAEGFPIAQQIAMFGSRENAVFFSMYADKNKQKVYDASFHGLASALRGSFSNLNLEGIHSVKELKGPLNRMLSNYGSDVRHCVRQEYRFDNSGDADLRVPEFGDLIRFLSSQKEEVMKNRIEALGFDEVSRSKQLLQEHFLDEAKKLSMLLKKSNETKIDFGKSKKDVMNTDKKETLKILISFGKLLMSYGYCGDSNFSRKVGWAQERLDELYNEANDIAMPSCFKVLCYNAEELEGLNQELSLTILENFKRMIPLSDQSAMEEIEIAIEEKSVNKEGDLILQ